MNRLKYVDGLRGIFALVVALFHTDSATFFPGGYLAVDFFFILSGFVLTYVYLQRMEGLTFLHFAGQRFSRLWPLHVATLFLFLAAFSISHALAGHDLSDPGLWGNSTPATFVQNIFMVHDLGYNIQPSWNFPSWSVSVEFYVNLALFFALLGLVQKAKTKWILGVIALMTLSYFAIDIWKILSGSAQGRETDYYTRGIFYSHMVRGFFEIFTGVLIYFAANKLINRPAAKTGGSSLMVSAAEILLLGGVLFIVSKPAGGFNDTLGVFLFAILLLLLSSYKTSIVKSALSYWPFLFLGKISYAVYLTHIPVIYFFRQWSEIFGTIENPVLDTLYFITLLFAAIFILSTVLHFYVEIPAQKWLRNLFAGKKMSVANSNSLQSSGKG